MASSEHSKMVRSDGEDGFESCHHRGNLISWHWCAVVGSYGDINPCGAEYRIDLVLGIMYNTSNTAVDT